MNSKRRNPSRDFSTDAIGRRAVLKGSMLGSAVLAERLLAGLLPNPARAEARDLGQEANTASSAGNISGKPLGEIEQIKLEYVFQIRIEFSERVSFKTPNGRRAYVPAISGVIEGPRLQGRVVPRSGADYAGNGRLNAHYMLQASDGTMIYINNTGYIYPKNGKPIDRNDPSLGRRFRLLLSRYTGVRYASGSSRLAHAHGDCREREAVRQPRPHDLYVLCRSVAAGNLNRLPAVDKTGRATQ